MSKRLRIAESNYGDAVTVDMHRWYAVLREAEMVVGVIGTIPGDGLGFYESVGEWEKANG